ncbi:unnamed protein product [Lymnaea stagnalis]|uniref:Thioredoxin domain-containing protein n=1 Tax=Lymnaea stagnalis TaxID=6523 RepID=A0AAV2HBD3_LYMST
MSKYLPFHGKKKQKGSDARIGSKRKTPLHPLERLLGESLRKSGDTRVSPVTFAVEEGKDGIIGLYFAANWCPPCKIFTSHLALMYDEVKKAGRKFEVVFVSFDYNQQSYEEYFAKMPWCAIDYTETDKREEVAEEFGIKGIPVLLFLDAATFKPTTLNGREIVMLDPRGEKFPWKKPWTPETVQKLSDATTVSSKMSRSESRSSGRTSTSVYTEETPVTLKKSQYSDTPRPSEAALAAKKHQVPPLSAQEEKGENSKSQSPTSHRSLKASHNSTRRKSDLNKPGSATNTK